MKHNILLLIAIATASLLASAQTAPAVYVDASGTMRWNTTNDEASFYGVNYTTPFAHAYREISRRGVDHKAAIDADVYHMARLGFNAFRIHIWDIEISDSVGNLVDNHHLDLLDYLLAKLEERGISSVITTMTNFGNGYPERNIDNGAFSYRYDKCDIHSNPLAQDAQRRYIAALLQHRNRYNGKLYATDPNIVGFEINNEPCHTGSPETTQHYIATMLDAMRNAGCTRPIFYNASHNMGHIAAYFANKIDGATYQWYPTGLVAGYSRKGNFLPAVDSYAIPFDTVAGFADKAKIIYEFDPADITYSYMYPAIARSFRSAGFQWITQFAYDPTAIADCNTECQTHYLNLAYTPTKAISMLVAAEVAYNVKKDEQFAAYPADTVFCNTTVSYSRDLSIYNTPERFYHSNHCNVSPVDASKIEHIAAVGSSPIIGYEGTGAYFLDKLENGVWRLEVMPDAVAIADAYAKSSPKRRVVETIWNEWTMTVNLPNLGSNFLVENITAGNANVRCAGNEIVVSPGVYLLKNRKAKSRIEWGAESTFGNKRVGEFVAPQPHEVPLRVVHTAQPTAQQGAPLTIECEAIGDVDSVVVYPSWISFWRSQNPYVTMKRTRGYTYSATIDAAWTAGDQFGYYIVAYGKNETRTFPDNVIGAPLDWDSQTETAYAVRLQRPDAIVPLITSAANDERLEFYALPHYEGIAAVPQRNMPASADALHLTFSPKGEPFRYFVRKYIADALNGIKPLLAQNDKLVVVADSFRSVAAINVTLITKHGIAYTKRMPVDKSTSKIEVPISDLRQSPTAILPIGYPSFTPSYFTTDTPLPFDIEDVEFLEISTDEVSNEVEMRIVGAYFY